MAGGQETGDYASKLSICAAGLMGEDLLASIVPGSSVPGAWGHLSSSAQTEPELPTCLEPHSKREWLVDAEPRPPGGS